MSMLGGLGGGVVGSAVVKMYLDADAYKRELSETEAATAAATAKMSGQASAFGMATEAALLPAIGGFVALTGVFVNAAIESERVLSALRAQVGDNTAAYEEQALALQRLTGASDEAILSADTILARFKLTSTEIQQAIPIVLDYAQATGKDIPAAASAIGKALLGNARALKEVGIDFTATGNRGEDFATIMSGLEDKVGGAAEAFGETAAGKLQIMREEFDNLMETVGGEILPLFADDLIPAITGLAKIITPVLTDAISDNVDAVKLWMDGLINAYDAIRTVTDAAADLGVSLEDSGLSLTGIVETLSPTAAKFIEASQSIGEMRRETEEATAAAQDWISTTIQQTRSNIEEFMLGAAESAGILKGEQSDLEAQTERTTAALERQVDRLFRLQSAQLELAGGFSGLLEASRSYADAQATLAELERDGKRSTDEYRAATKELVDERVGLISTFEDFVRENAGQIGSIRDAKRAFIEYGREAGITGAALRNLISSSFGPLRDLVRDTNQQLDVLDGRSVNVDVNVQVHNMSDLLQLKGLV